jgi:hypothetical protein
LPGCRTTVQSSRVRRFLYFGTNPILPGRGAHTDPRHRFPGFVFSGKKYSYSGSSLGASFFSARPKNFEDNFPKWKWLTPRAHIAHFRPSPSVRGKVEIIHHSARAGYWREGSDSTNLSSSASPCFSEGRLTLSRGAFALFAGYPEFPCYAS